MHRTTATAAVLGLIVCLCACADAEVVTIADSSAQFSATQGQDNWFYGYTAYGTRHSYDPNTMFSQMAYYDSGANRWQQSETLGQPHWTLLNSGGCHPASQYLPVRRWTSEINGEITIRGSVETPHSSSDGTYSYVWVNGDRLYHAFHDGGAAAKNYNVTATVSVGDSVDFGLDHKSSTSNDSTKFSSYIDFDQLEADAGGDYVVDVGGSVQLAGAAHAGTAPYSYLWDIDDNGDYSENITDADATLTYAYLTETLGMPAGDHTITLQVTDANEPQTDTAGLTIVPEPTTLSLLAVGLVMLLGLIGRPRRR
jgi:hypothetical protein